MPNYLSMSQSNKNLRKKNDTPLAMSYFVLPILLLLLPFGTPITVNLKNSDVVFVSGVPIYLEGNQASFELQLTAPLAEVGKQTTERADGSVAIITGVEILSVDLLKKAQELGAVAAITGTSYDVGGIGQLFSLQANASGLVIPTFEIGFSDFKKLSEMTAKDAIANVSIGYDDVVVNLWQEVMDSPWSYLWQITLGLFSLSILVMATIQLVRFAKYQGGIQPSTANFVLFVILLANILRLIFLIDFFGFRGLYPFILPNLLAEITIPLEVISSLLIVLYWHEIITDSSLTVSPFIRKLRIPFYVLSALLISVHIMRVVLIAFNIARAAMSLFTAMFYAALNSGLIIFYGVTGAKLLKRMAKSSGEKIHHKTRLRHVTVRILASGFVLLAIIIIAFLFVLRQGYTPNCKLDLSTWLWTNKKLAFFVLWFLLYATLNVHDLLYIFVFNPPKKRSSQTSESTASKNVAAHV